MDNVIDLVGAIMNRHEWCWKRNCYQIRPCCLYIKLSKALQKKIVMLRSRGCVAQSEGPVISVNILGSLQSNCMLYVIEHSYSGPYILKTVSNRDESRGSNWIAERFDIALD